MYKQKKFPDRRSAFTLVEIMVAAAITIIMIGLVIQITSDVLRIWNRSMGKLSANAEARITMELLSTDLESALFVDNGQQWMRVEHVPSNIGSPAVGQTVGLKLFASALDNPDSQGNICAVAYRLAHEPAYSTASSESFVLFRAIEGSEQTFEELLSASDDGPQKELTGGFWGTASITDPDNYLAGNIVDFKIYMYGKDADGNATLLNDANQDGEIDQDYFYGGTGESDEVPTSAEIFLTVVSDEGMEILAAFADPDIRGAGTGFESPDEVIRQHGEVFRRRVEFQAKPL